MSVDKYVPLDVISSAHLKEYVQTKIISHDREVCMLLLLKILLNIF